MEGDNQKLKSTKAHHFVLGYSFNINKNTTVKIEPYYQHLYDVPVIADSSFSLINYVNDYQIKDKLKNTGTGSNYGLELTLERFFYNNIYYLVTGSVFQSKYKGDDGVERNTRFNRRYIINGLFGKEFLVGKRRTNYLGLNGKFVFQGGDYRSPVDFKASNQQKEPVYDDSKPFSVQNKGSFMLDCSITYKINKPKYSSTWAIQVKNVTASKYNTEIEYNYEVDKLIVESDAVVVPSISYKIEF